MATPADWLVPDWPAPPNVRALCSARSGGVSLPPYDSLNLGTHVGDAPAAVQANRGVYANALGARPVFLDQVHGQDCIAITSATADGARADGCVTTERGLACTMMVADCLPVLLCDDYGRAVAAAHAGWRGLAGQGGQGILESVFKSFQAVAPGESACRASKTIAWLGPCIGPQAFEVGPEVKAAFVAHDAQAAALFRPLAGGKFLADLPGLARLRLAALGVSQVYGNDGSRAWCTVVNPSRFFSHRRDRVSGRLAVSVWLA
ncbi:peptidoglycan editing factor PgeF [uncultured Ramlibacter sp.]|mgnify:CR=1 FL=1|uniref:peptidoglycan editing factor PgeF n=1 Tax=uncultured Ramlibacter sp. TaxID=260755 RepID=UPI002628260F|nr:peptidoglycan editing factor PgeF [uncultured Ramlibacter sp.]